MLSIGIVIGSTRPGRTAPAVASWVLERARGGGRARFELIDPAAFDLPLLDEPRPASTGAYARLHTRRFAEAIAPLDGFVFVVPEYNHGLSGALKNALDFLYAEWNDKAAGIVSYGSVGGARAAEQLRLVLGELRVADVRDQVLLQFDRDFDERGLAAGEERAAELDALVDQVLAWAGALRPLRARRAAA